jgi:uncharacterized protein (TIGR02996 family)
VSTEAAILRAVCDRPEDDLPRLVYADWLEDHAGYTPDPDAAGTRAEFIRVQVELARAPGNTGCHGPGPTDRGATRGRGPARGATWRFVR